jgi:hypothetical protein
MIEPLLVTVEDPPAWIDTSVPDVKAAVLRSPRGVLVLPMWLGNGAQYVPGQSAGARLRMVVPQVPLGTQGWEVTPGEVHGSIHSKRVAGGTEITLNEFGLTTAIVFTSDISLIVRFQEEARSKRKLAAQWTRDLAVLEMEKALRVEQQLEQAGHFLPDGKSLIDDAQKRLKTCEQLWNNHLYSDAYREAQRAMRPIRILMRAQWETAMKKLDTPVATPYAVSFYTLPQHWDLMARVGMMKPGPNTLQDGTFEVAPNQHMPGWTLQDLTLDGVMMTARRVTEVIGEVVKPVPPPKPGKPPATTTKLPPIITREAPREGNQCLLLEIKPKDPQNPPAALQRTFLAVHSPAVKLKPGSWVQISGWVRIPRAITASADGALMYDSAGGEPLAIRFTDPLPWKKYTVYRQVPSSGLIHVTLALTGIGRAYFDDIRIEPLSLEGNRSAGAVASR